MLPKRRKKPKMMLREPSQIRSPQHLAWIRGHECVLNGLACMGRLEAAHVRTGTDGGTSVKPSDSWTLPLCSYHHLLQHNMGETNFERRYGINMKAIASELWQRSPHRRKYEESHR